MKKGDQFINNDTGRAFEIVGVTCKIAREDGEIFSLDIATLQYLLDAKMILKVKEGNRACLCQPKRANQSNI